ncbi:hypothetical protein BSL78_07635 [Apostichopus japonicus]|uniref:Helix-turn-helix domain-containing protein n=1 Tax=Stichopus japonicus TaxID=307972 RepID=A0A2G8L5K5_STIJA|nr:hypothetical protein BSL78_07635 [Apostichopus japonicus]
MYQRNQISKKAVSFLSPTDCKAARFYLLPKIHKPGNPGRPIISAMGPPPRRYPCLWTTSSNLLFLRLILISMTLQISSGNLKISKTKSPVQPSSVLSTSLLCTLTSLMLKVSQPRVQPCLRRSTLVHPSLTSKLSCNRFSPKQLHVHGQALPSKTRDCHGNQDGSFLACLFMSSLEERMLSTAPCCPLIWWRYIDDILLWTSDEDSLLTFINHINSFHSTIKFTSDYSHQQVNFLDVTVRKEHGSLSTDLYTKPTDTHQYLHSSSCHPRHCKSGIAYSQALRLRRICSNNSSFIRHTDALEKHLIARGHSARRVREAIQRVRSLSRSSTLAVKDKKGRDCDNKLPLVVTFHPNLPPFRKSPLTTTTFSSLQIDSNEPS